MFSIRRAERGDSAEIAGNWTALMGQNRRFNPRLLALKPDSLAVYKKFLEKQFSSKKARVFVAEADGKVIGHVMVSVKKLPPVYAIDTEAYVDELFVKERFRGKGVGTALLREAEKWAKQMGLREFSLATNVKNTRAQKVYRDFGFGGLNLKLVKFLG
ncbi:MAG: GNAT family N-acetyltransferase [Candidatus Micrarchaeota archaeon]|nr:GNAT family N-acetyltransferase [Candidatus Micrarchaeota archaeon]